MRDGLVIGLLSLVPRKAATRSMGWMARLGASRLGVRLFAWAYDVDVGEAEHPIETYRTLDAFFTRRLLDGVRPVDERPDVLVSPVDGRVAWVGTTQDGSFDVAPGRPCRVASVLDAAVDGERDVAVLYLSPRDYHRVHSPCAWQVKDWRYVPGAFWPVFPAAVRTVKELFGRNERLVLRGQGPTGPVDLVMVGAFGVARIEVAWPDVGTNRAGEGAFEAQAAAGSEVGMFHLGSTVILVAPAGTWQFEVGAGDRVRVGRAIGRFAKR